VAHKRILRYNGEKSTQTMPDQIQLPPPIKFLSGKEIYDSIMQQIEPELVSVMLPTLKEKYKNETAEEKTKRKDRYNKAFAKYHEMYTAYMADLDARIHRYHKEAMRSIEDFTRRGEDRALEELETSVFKLI
jgi:RPA family protein